MQQITMLFCHCSFRVASYKCLQLPEYYWHPSRSGSNQQLDDYVQVAIQGTPTNDIYGNWNLSYLVHRRGNTYLIFWSRSFHSEKIVLYCRYPPWNWKPMVGSWKMQLISFLNGFRQFTPFIEFIAKTQFFLTEKTPKKTLRKTHISQSFTVKSHRASQQPPRCQ